MSSELHFDFQVAVLLCQDFDVKLLPDFIGQNYEKFKN
jgi:hypothetical protein